jgi:hypothetical protein
MTVALAASLFGGTIETTTTTTVISTTFDFGNGSSVQIENPLRIPAGIILIDPQFLGAGGGGAVFSYRRLHDNGSAIHLLGNKLLQHEQQQQEEEGQIQPHQLSIRHINENVAVKISWLHSASSVRNECNVLKVMEQLGVMGVERCVAEMEYKDDPRRVMIVMEPLVSDDAVSSIEELSSKATRRQAVSNLMQTTAQMLAARVVTTDIQPLISTTTGELTLIDMTEARVLTHERLSGIDKALVHSFLTEILSLVPESLLKEASESFQTELHRLQDSVGIELHEDFIEIIDNFPIVTGSTD